MIANKESLCFRAAMSSVLAATVLAFQTTPSLNRVGSALKVVVDPSTITNKEYEDICGVSFNEQSLHDRLKSTKFLYPKHVEVIEDIGPMAGRMVDEIVSDESSYAFVTHIRDIIYNHRILISHFVPTPPMYFLVLDSFWKQERRHGSLKFTNINSF